MTEQKRYARLTRGDPAPWFRQRATGSASYSFDTVAGRCLALCFYASSSDPASRAALDAVEANRALFDDDRAAFFGVTIDPRDEAEGRVAAFLPGLRHFFDFDGSVSRAYGSIAADARPESGTVEVRRFWLVLDRALRVVANVPFAPDGSDREAVFRIVRDLAYAPQLDGADVHAPVLFLRDVFEPELCRRLIAHYEARGGVESGFMREVDGKTVGVYDHARKRRRDVEIDDRELVREIQIRFRRRVAPEIAKAHHFAATRMERYIVGCYSAEDGGHFRAHRDNTTSGTAHRRFAASVNLNDDFDGGAVSFPEFGPRSFKPPAGGAVVFSCSFLHEVSKVTRGVRYAFLPFLYDDAAAAIRERNRDSLVSAPPESAPA